MNISKIDENSVSESRNEFLLKNRNLYTLETKLKNCLYEAAYPSGLDRFNLTRFIKGRLNSGNCFNMNFDTIKATNYIKWSLAMCNNEYKDYIDNNVVINLFDDHYDADISLYPGCESSLYKINLMNIVLSNLYSYCQSKNLRVFVLVIPSKLDLCNDCYFILNKDKYRKYKPFRLSHLIEVIAQMNKLECFNLYDDFRNNNPTSLYFKGDNNHWDDVGQNFAAKLTAEKIFNLLNID